MRARHRHFNARDCDAALCLDARFISGKSDNDDVETWDDRSRNASNATQSTVANRPLYKTTIQGGQPVVRFDGSAASGGDFYPMTTALAASFKNKSYGLILATAQDRTPTSGASQHFIFYHSRPEVGFARVSLSTRDSGGNRFRSAGRRLDTDSFSAATNSASDGDWHIFAAEYEWANNVNRLRVDHIQAATNTFSSGAGSTSNTNAGNVEIGSGGINPTLNAAPIDLAQFVVLNTATSTALVKRLHHAAAFSFKIACN